MAGLLIIGFFIAVALAVFYAAMRGESGSVSRARRRSSKASRRFVTLAALAAFLVFGVVLPGLVLIYNAGDQAAAGAGGTRLTAGERDGRDLFVTNCATCHSLDDSGSVGKVGPDLDALRPARGLTIDAIKNGRARGQGQMPAELLEGGDAEDVAAYLVRVAGR